jgi:hypothetical protein
MADKQDTHNPRVARIHRTANEVLDLVHNAIFTVSLDDFGDWLTALDRPEFYVTRREDTAELLVFFNGMYRGQYIAVHARGAQVVHGHEIPEDRHLTLPAAEVGNVRASVAVS